jgi:hypothetical protein
MLRRARIMVVRGLGWRRSPWRRTMIGVGAVTILGLAGGCGAQVSRSVTSTPSTSPAPPAAASTTAATTAPPSTTAPSTTAPSTATTSTTVPCALSSTPGTANTVPVGPVCSAAGAPHFDTPRAAMTYLARAWNTDNVRELDYVTDPAGRAEMNSMATLMMNLRFRDCTKNPAGDYTCYFLHDIAPSTSPTTYPDPAGYPPGEAVFTVAPAQGPGWYLTEVIHCG